MWQKSSVTPWSPLAPSRPLPAERHQPSDSPPGHVSEHRTGEAVMSTIEDRLRDILIEDLFVELEKEKILPTYSLRQDLGLDSLGFVELKEQVERRFGIVIAEDDFTPENFSTLSSLASLIHQHGPAKGAQQ
jgi:acyl carrier protein